MNRRDPSMSHAHGSSRVSQDNRAKCRWFQPKPTRLDRRYRHNSAAPASGCTTGAISNSPISLAVTRQSATASFVTLAPSGTSIEWLAKNAGGCWAIEDRIAGVQSDLEPIACETVFRSRRGRARRRGKPRSRTGFMADERIRIREKGGHFYRLGAHSALGLASFQRCFDHCRRILIAVLLSLVAEPLRWI